MVYGGDTIIGVLKSSPLGCREDKQAATYTRVSSFLQFIEDAVNDKSKEEIRTHEYITKDVKFSIFESIVNFFKKILGFKS